MTIKKRFIIAYLSAIAITFFSLYLIFALISYTSLGQVSSVTKIYRILTSQRPLTQEEKDSFSLMSSILKKSPNLFETPLNEDVKEAITKIEAMNLNVVLRKNKSFTYFSKDLVERSLHAHAPDYELNNFEPTGTIDNNGRFFHYIKTDFQYLDGSKGSFAILKRESNLYEFFIRWGIWVVLLILGIAVFAFWYISRRLGKTVIEPLITLEKNTREIVSGKEISSVESFVEAKESTKEIGQLQASFKQMWEDLHLAQLEQKKYEDNRKELITNISHDLRTPMTSIIGYVEGLKDGVANTEEKRQLYLNTIHEKSLTLNELIDELFLYSKLDLDGIPFKMEKIEIISYLRNIVEELQWDDAVEVTCDFSEEELYATLDRVQSDRVMANLIQNSYKFRDMSKEKLKITVSVTREEKRLKISFSDNGLGIPSADLDRIFDRFYRVDKSRTPTVKGSGLGLSIVKQIVKHHQGELEVTSEVGEGTTISILLPLLEEESRNEH